MSASAVNGISSLEDKIQQRINASPNALETIPSANHHQGKIPNTPAASSTIAFCLGGLFSFGLYTAVLDAFSKPFQTPYQLGLYLAAWAFFHWAEFTVTAAWNLEKCSIDCTSFSTQIFRMLTRSLIAYLLENGSMYHFAHTAAIVEFLVSRYFTPSFKSFPYVSQVGIMLVIFGQVLRSVAMIHASTNFSHAVALQKRVGHKLVTHKIYACVFLCSCS